MLGKKDYIKLKMVFCDAFGTLLKSDNYHLTGRVDIYEDNNSEFNLKKLQSVVIGKIITVNDLKDEVNITLLGNIDLTKEDTKLVKFTPYGSYTTFCRLLKTDEIVVEDIEALLEYITLIKDKFITINNEITNIKKLIYKHTY